MIPTSSTARMGVPQVLRGLAGIAIVAALLGACSSPPVPAFDLSAPRGPVRRGISIPGQLVVLEPTALQPLEAERIIVRDVGGAISVLGGGQWSDRLPRVLQARMIETFENISALTVSRPGDGVTADLQLNTQIRAFQLDAPRNEVVVELSEKLLSSSTGKIIRARVFTARAPVTSSQAGEVAQALDGAMSKVFVEIARWVGDAR